MLVRSTQQRSLVSCVLDTVRGSSRLSACGAPPAQRRASVPSLGIAQSKCQVIGRTGCILIRRPGSLPPTDEAAPGLVRGIHALQSVRPWPNTPYSTSMSSKYLTPSYSPPASPHLLLRNTTNSTSLILLRSPSGYARLLLDDPLADYVSSPCPTRPVPFVNSSSGATTQDLYRGTSLATGYLDIHWHI